MDEPEPSREVVSKITRCSRCLKTKLGDEDTIVDTVRSANSPFVFENAAELPELRLFRRDLMENRHLWILRCALESARYSSGMHASDSIRNKKLRYLYSRIVSMTEEHSGLNLNWIQQGL